MEKPQVSMAPLADRSREKFWLTAGIVFLGCALALFLNPFFFWADDYQIERLPMWTEAARAVRNLEWPILTPYTWTVPSLSGEYQPAVFSLFIQPLLALVMDSPLPFWGQATAIAAAHLVILATGTYVLARQRGAQPEYAAMAGVALAFSGYTVLWGATAWVTPTAGFAWVPWFWWALIRISEKPCAQRAVVAAVILYLLFAAGWPFANLMAAGFALLEGGRAIGKPDFRKRAFWLAATCIWGLMLATPAIWGLVEYSAGSSRDAQGIGSMMSTPPLAWLGLLAPHGTNPWFTFGAKSEPHTSMEIACGTLPALLVLTALCVMPRELWKRNRLELCLVVLGILLSCAPLPRPLRFAFRWIPLAHLGLVLAAAKLPDLAPRRVAITGTAWLLAAWGLAVVLPPTRRWDGLLIDLAAPAAGLVIWLLLKKEQQQKALPWLVLAVSLATYAPTGGNDYLATYDLDKRLLEQGPLEKGRLYYSMYASPNRYQEKGDICERFQIIRPGNLGMLAEIEMLNGYTPIGATKVAKLLDAPSSGLIRKPFLERWQKSSADSFPEPLFSDLGVDGVILSYEFYRLVPHAPPGWSEVHRSRFGLVYHRDQRSPRVATADPVTQKIDPEPLGVALRKENRRSVDIEVTPSDKARIVFVRRSLVTGYRALLNGKLLPLTSIQEMMPAVEIPAGTGGNLRFIYSPPSFRYGLAISGVAAASMCLACWTAKRRSP